MNDWKTLVFDATFITAVISIITAIRYRKQNKKLKDLEVKNKESETKVADIDAQRAQIDLGKMFTVEAAEMFNKMQELQEKTLKATEKNGIDNEGILRQLNDLKEEQKRFAEEQLRQSEEIKRIAEEQKKLSDCQADIVSFLDGEFDEFVKNRSKKNSPKVKKTTGNKQTSPRKKPHAKKEA